MMKVSKTLAISISFILLLAFSIHAISFDHHHPSAPAWMGIEEALHTMNRKLFVLALLIFMAAIIFISIRNLLENLSSRLGLDKCRSAVLNIVYRLFSPTRKALREGTLHRQTYA